MSVELIGELIEGLEQFLESNSIDIESSELSSSNLNDGVVYQDGEISDFHINTQDLVSLDNIEGHVSLSDYFNQATWDLLNYKAFLSGLESLSILTQSFEYLITLDGFEEIDIDKKIDEDLYKIKGLKIDDLLSEGVLYLGEDVSKLKNINAEVIFLSSELMEEAIAQGVDENIVMPLDISISEMKKEFAKDVKVISHLEDEFLDVL